MIINHVADINLHTLRLGYAYKINCSKYLVLSYTWTRRDRLWENGTTPPSYVCKLHWNPELLYTCKWTRDYLCQPQNKVLLALNKTAHAHSTRTKVSPHVRTRLTQTHFLLCATSPHTVQTWFYPIVWSLCVNTAYIEVFFLQQSCALSLIHLAICLRDSMSVCFCACMFVCMYAFVTDKACLFHQDCAQSHCSSVAERRWSSVLWIRHCTDTDKAMKMHEKQHTEEIYLAQSLLCSFPQLYCTLVNSVTSLLLRPLGQTGFTLWKTRCVLMISSPNQSVLVLYHTKKSGGIEGGEKKKRWCKMQRNWGKTLRRKKKRLN